MSIARFSKFLKGYNLNSMHMYWTELSVIDSINDKLNGIVSSKASST